MSGFFARKSEAMQREEIKASLLKSRQMNELFSHIYFVKAMGMLGLMIRRYFRLIANSMRLSVRSNLLRMASRESQNIYRKIFYGVVGFTNSIMVIKGKITLGSLGAIMAYLTQGIGAYESVLRIGKMISANRIQLERTAEILDIEIDVKEKRDAKDVDFLDGTIEFKDASFEYIEGKNIIKNINFAIPPKAKIALVGHSGVGKTTILSLILRLYDVNKGAVLLEGCDVRDMRLRSIASQVGIAFQEPFMLNDTILYNIVFGNPKITKKRCRRSRAISRSNYIHKRDTR